MYSAHPDEIVLARLAETGDGAADAETLEHLRWCARCRTLVADYRWLQDEMVDTLEAAADAVHVPWPRWQAVREGLIMGRRKQNAAGRVSAIASAVLAVCLMFFQPLIRVPSWLGSVGVSQTSQQASSVLVMSYPEAAIATAPTAAVSSSTLSGSTSAATPTPSLTSSGQNRDAAAQPTPVCMQLPTPPQPENLNL
jgi:hypothetical protein